MEKRSQMRDMWEERFVRLDKLLVKMKGGVKNGRSNYY